MIPFAIQMIAPSVMIILIVRSRSRSKATSQRHQTFITALRKEFRAKIENYITPIIIMLSALPHTIISFAYACTELKQDWQRYAFLLAFFLTYIPQILGFILCILPSEYARNEFRQTNIGKWLFNIYSQMKCRKNRPKT
jgi:uncharacterized membrane protein YdjX (TVP38/TMEM64 family)